jgi:hypothetical protein
METLLTSNVPFFRQKSRDFARKTRGFVTKRGDRNATFSKIRKRDLEVALNRGAKSPSK